MSVNTPNRVNGPYAHHGDEASDEAEVREVVGVDGGGRIDLQTVVVLASVLKEAIHGVEDFVGQQEEPFPAERQDTSRHARRGKTWEGKAGTSRAFFPHTSSLHLIVTDILV